MKSKKINTFNLRFAGMQGFYWAAYTVLFGFYVPLLEEWGYSNFMIGAAMTVVSLTRMIAQPIWGMYCDRKGKVREMFIFAMAASCLVVLFLPFGESSFAVSMLLVFLLSVTMQSMYPLIDAWSLGLSNDGHDIDFGITRSFGSLAYALVAAGFGLILDRFGPYTRIPSYILLTAALIIPALTLRSPAKRYHCGSGSKESSFRSLVKIKKYRVFIIANMLLYLVYGALNSFLPVRIRELGGTNLHLGLCFTIMGICQVFGMIIFSVLRRKVYIFLHITLVISMFLFAIKGFLTAISPNLGSVLILQVIDLISYGMYFPGAIAYINETAGSDNLMTAQTLFSASTYGMSAMAGSFAGGVISGYTSIPVMLIIMASASLTGVILFVSCGKPILNAASRKERA